MSDESTRWEDVQENVEPIDGTVLSLNIWARSAWLLWVGFRQQEDQYLRASAFFKKIEGYDLIGLQEFFFNEEEVAALVPPHYSYFQEQNMMPRLGNGLAIISKWPIVEKASLCFQNNRVPFTLSAMGALLTKIALPNGRFVYMGTCHLVSDLEEQDFGAGLYKSLKYTIGVERQPYQETRIRQVHEVRQFILQKLAAWGADPKLDRVILTGDFNLDGTDATCPDYLDMMNAFNSDGGLHFSDVLKPVSGSRPETYPTFLLPCEEPKHGSLDYVLVSNPPESRFEDCEDSAEAVDMLIDKNTCNQLTNLEIKTAMNGMLTDHRGVRARVTL